MRVFITLATFVLIFGSCSDEFSLRQSVFIEDPSNPGLPQYSEWGYNTFGAYYNRDVYVSNDNDVPLRIYSSRSAQNITLEFTGMIERDYFNPLTMKLIFHGQQASDYTDLLSFHEKTVDISGENVELLIARGSQLLRVEVLRGAFNFKRAQHLFVDGESTQVILSGTFDFQVIIDGAPVAITLGRFDAGVSNYNFFVLP